MRLVISPWLRALGGVLLAAVLAGTPGTVRAGDDREAPRPDPTQEAMARLEQMLDLMDRRLADFPGPLGRWRGAALPAGGEGRLGAAVSAPGAALADQLDLPDGQGLVLTEIRPASAADKAGFKKFDILLEVNGKPVSSKPAALRKQLAGIAAETPAEAVVLRKGKKETIRGLRLPEPRAAAFPFDGALPGLDEFPWRGGVGPLTPPGAGGQVTSVTREGDRFTATQKDGKLSVTVKGSVKGGEVKVEGVTIDDGSGPKTYEAVDGVPAEHRKRVEALSRMAGGRKAADEF